MSISALTTPASHNRMQNKINEIISAVNATVASVTLSSSGWSGKTQTKSVPGVTASNTVVVAPAPAYQSLYTDAGIICSAQGASSLMFTAETVPAENIVVNILIFN